MVFGIFAFYEECLLYFLYEEKLFYWELLFNSLLRTAIMLGVAILLGAAGRCLECTVALAKLALEHLSELLLLLLPC